MPDASANIQHSPFNMLHGKTSIKKKGKSGVESKKPKHTSSSHKGFGHFGAASPGGRGKP